MMNSTKIIYGLYGDEDDLLNGVKLLMEKNIIINEVYTPFPVHGLDKALKLKKTRISDITFIYGMYGFLFSCALTWFIMIHDWPQNIGGKPNFSWYLNMPAFVPVIFELTVFCAAHLMVITYFLRNKMFPGAETQNPDPRTTDDKFLIEIHSNDIDNIKKLLMDTGVEEVTLKTIYSNS